MFMDTKPASSYLERTNMATPTSTSPSKSRSESTDTKLTVELGPYVVHDLIDRQDTGNVFRAHHSQLKQPVAIKVLPPLDDAQSAGKSWSEDCISQFSQELETATHVVHDNVARPTHIGALNDVRYVAMEYVDGVSLQKIVERDGTVDYTIACEVVLQAAAGLRHIHEKGLVHRDIRPANLVLTRTGVIKITDLGIGPLKVTDTSEQLGDLAYLAPEQLGSGDVDIRSDIYGLGCTLYRLLSGQVPKREPQFGNRPQPLQQLVPDLPEELYLAVDRMIADSPEARFQCPDDVVVEMCNWASDEKLPDLVAWHMNTQNAGLAPAATFARLDERMRKREKMNRAERSTRKLLTDAKEKKLNLALARRVGLIAASFAVPLVGAMAMMGFGASESKPKVAPVVAAAQREILTDASYHALLLRDLEANHGLPAGTWTLPPHESIPTRNAICYGATATHADITGFDFKQSVQLRVNTQGEQDWDAGYFFEDVGAMQAGDRLLIAVWLRTASVEDVLGERGKVSLFVEDASDEKDVYILIEPSDQWQQYLIPFEAKSDEARKIGFHLASRKQVIEYGGLALINYGQSIPFSNLPIQLNGDRD